MTLTNLRKKDTIRTLINYCCVPGKSKPAFAGLADLQNLPHKWHGFRIFAHNPKVPSSNLGHATRKGKKGASLGAFFVNERRNQHWG
jgi:hypothetical protein